jgi:hypothetical protein
MNEDEQENQQCTERDGFRYGWATSVRVACDEFLRKRGIPITDYSRWRHWEPVVEDSQKEEL